MAQKKNSPGTGVKLILFALLLLVNIGTDRLTKYTAVQNLQGKGTVRVAGNVLVLRYAENRGAFLSAGSMLPEGLRKILLIIIPAAVIMGGTVYFICKIAGSSMLQIAALGGLIGGGISNLYDRIAHGGVVVDFLNIGIGRLRTGIFNTADLSILGGGLLLMIAVIGNDRHRQGNAAGQSKSESSG